MEGEGKLPERYALPRRCLVLFMDGVCCAAVGKSSASRTYLQHHQTPNTDAIVSKSCCGGIVPAPVDKHQVQYKGELALRAVCCGSTLHSCLFLHIHELKDEDVRNCMAEHIAKIQC